MKLSKKLHFIFVPTLMLIAGSSLYYPEPFSNTYAVMGIGSFFLCSLVGVSAIIRKGNIQIFSPNPVTQVKAARSTSLNRIEGMVLIYAIFVLAGCFFGGILYPVIHTLKDS